MLVRLPQQNILVHVRKDGSGLEVTDPFPDLFLDDWQVQVIYSQRQLTNHGKCFLHSFAMLFARDNPNLSRNLGSRDCRSR